MPEKITIELMRTEKVEVELDYPMFWKKHMEGEAAGPVGGPGSEVDMLVRLDGKSIAYVDRKKRGKHIVYEICQRPLPSDDLQATLVTLETGYERCKPAEFYALLHDAMDFCAAFVPAMKINARGLN